MLALAKKHRLTLLFLRMEKDLRTVGERVREWLDLGLGVRARRVEWESTVLSPGCYLIPVGALY
jgi:hypothetical protein